MYTWYEENKTVKCILGCMVKKEYYVILGYTHTVKGIYFCLTQTTPAENNACMYKKDNARVSQADVEHVLIR